MFTCLLSESPVYIIVQYYKYSDSRAEIPSPYVQTCPFQVVGSCFIQAWRVRPHIRLLPTPCRAFAATAAGNSRSGALRRTPSLHRPCDQLLHRWTATRRLCPSFRGWSVSRSHWPAPSFKFVGSGWQGRNVAGGTVYNVNKRSVFLRVGLTSDAQLHWLLRT